MQAEKKGVPMESPISGILAELKLWKLEGILKIKFKIRIKIWLRYVDDIFVILEKDTDKIRLLEELNTIEKLVCCGSITKFSSI